MGCGRRRSRGVTESNGYPTPPARSTVQASCERQTYPRSRRMRDHLKILGWLYAASGGLVLLLAVLFGTLFGMAGIVAGGEQGGALIGGLGFAFALFIAAMGIPSLVCGWALLNYKPWARVLGIVLSALQLANFPVGT